ncbi:cytochrome cbb3 oxidase maturation protein CcoH [Mesoflavibacter sp. HG96]|uniref:FixH family protein n=1 Tax=Mesoflavibacter TaxID=444051 RepID=UPI000D0F8AF0|nr:MULTISPECIES: FixH family protein [Mesoflavibacter]QIJ89978.1 cytochrome cbb3 oxidase maturation protein CcoH [Mesoflavibacter sp. HG96]QIJ92706.1 cytochrome cbb3 oxidase maturation protein CcoH [Mesoflavibacter sp. HG37]
MKFNWGTGIVIAFVGFISFIMYFVINMSTNKKLDHDLVTEDYYKQELLYQNDINKEKNASKLLGKLSWKKSAEGMIITFPEDLDYNEIKGKVFLYRPSNKQLDFETTFSLSNHNLLIPDKRLLDGRWNIKIDWNYKGNNYLFKEEILY